MDGGAPGLKRKRLALALLAAVSFVVPAVEVAVTGRSEPFSAFGVADTVVSLVLLFWWYHMDKEQHGYRAGPLMNGGILVAAVVAFPIYLVRTRGWRRGGTAIALGAAFFAATYGLSELGEMLGHALA